jgi:hypothetical protein
MANCIACDIHAKIHSKGELWTGVFANLGLSSRPMIHIAATMI